MNKRIATALLGMALGLTLLNAGCGCGKGQPAGSCYSQVQPPAQHPAQ